MAYKKESPQSIFGEYYEPVVGKWLMTLGWYVMHTAQVGDGATMITGADGKEVMPDLNIYDLKTGRKPRAVQVKAKRGAYEYRKDKIVCTGCDWPDWEACCKINDSGMPVDFAFIHIYHPLRSSPDIRPQLLMQTVDVLRTVRHKNGVVGPMRIPPCEEFPRGGAVWDVDVFDVLGDLPAPPAYIFEALQANGYNMRPWEKPPKLRMPRIVPGQYELFSKDTEVTHIAQQMLGFIDEHYADNPGHAVHKKYDLLERVATGVGSPEDEALVWRSYNSAPEGLQQLFRYREP